MRIRKRNKVYGRDRSLEGSQYTFAWKQVRGRTCSVEQAAEKMGVSADTVRRMIHAGEILAAPVRAGVKGSPLRVSLDSVEGYACQQLSAHGISDGDIAQAPGPPQPQHGSRR